MMTCFQPLWRSLKADTLPAIRAIIATLSQVGRTALNALTGTLPHRLVARP